MIKTLGIIRNNLSDHPILEQMPPNYEPNTQQFDISKLELNDHGKLVNSESLELILKHIKNSRERNKNGVIVALFAHGWHHGGNWDDSHFVSFRKLLASLSLREAERYDANVNSRGRRVIGIYLAWDGDPAESWITGIPFLTHLTFWNRYSAANKIGSGEDLYKIVKSLILATKSPIESDLDNTTEHVFSPLILSGHSMGAVLIELAFLSVLKNNEAAISDLQPKGVDDIIDLKQNDESILAPDLVIALNSAADSEIAFEIKAALEQQKWCKVITAPSGEIKYNPPVLLSLTSSKDYSTGLIWRFARLFHNTDGHNSDLFTHTFNELYPATCSPKAQKDFGQCWHCLRPPEPLISKSPNFFIDLPLGERKEDGTLDHMRYELHSNSLLKEELAWIFQIPGELCKDHNDIFNPQMGSLVLALIQISGAVMSLAYNWEDTFEA